MEEVVIVSEPFPSPLVDMLIRDGAVTQPTVMGDLLRQRFEDEDRRIRQVESVWVPSGRFPGEGRWEEIEVIDAGTPPA
jgi:hypothetical protein